MTIFFTSDQHYFHRGALHFGKRQGFDSVEEMNETIIAKHNSRVTPQDTVYYLGDLSFGEAEETVGILNRLNGNKHWVPGNHDDPWLKATMRAEAVRSFFLTIRPLVDMKFGDQWVTMCHYPMLTWNHAHYGAWMLHGHSHGNCQYPHPGNRILDVGVDTNNFKPYSFDEVREYMLGLRASTSR